MHVLHENQQIQPRVAQSLHEASLDSLARLQAHSVSLDPVVGKLALFRGEPLSGERLIWKKKDAEDGYANCNHSFDDEQPRIHISLLAV